MDASQWDTLGSLIVQVLALPPAERTDFVDAACGSDAALRAEVASLLAAYEEAPAYFDSLGKDLGFGADAAAGGAAGDFTPDPYLLIGKEVAHYRVLEHLGGGGMGVVYKAEDTRLGRTSALKFLPPVWSRDEQARRRFQQEARAASALDHPNICTIYEINETEQGQFYIAMACYDGETLRAKIARGPLPIPKALDIAIQVAEGLMQAHSQGIIHRDVKPGNIIFTPENRVKILDFGLAKLAGSLQITRTGTTLGTVAYMAPEQARGETVDHRADVWSLGAMLYEMIAGQRAFPGDFHQAVLYGVLNLDPQPVTGLRPGVPMQLALLISKALAKIPTERYQRMADLLADLKIIRQREVDRTSVERAILSPLPEAASEPTASASAPPVLEPAADGPARILVVDDEPELELLVRQKFRRQIRTEEWSFVFAADGQEALEVVRADPDIAMVLTDLNMPRMDGLTLLTRLADVERPIKTVVVSAYGDMKNIRAAMNRGAFDFVTKPINFEDLEKTIRKTRQEWFAYRKAAEAQRQVAAMQQELEVARRIQEAILPLSFPTRDDVALYAFMSTARNVSGTFYDFFPIGDHRLGVMIGDVAGKGVSAALFMAMSQTFLKGIGTQGEAPGACLTSMNRMLFPEGFPDLAVTVCYAILDTETGTLSYCNAGHPAPYLLQAGGTVRLLESVDAPVWRQRDTAFTTRHVTLQPGEGLFFYTGGVIEAMDAQGHSFSAERLSARLCDDDDATPAQLIRHVVRAVMDHIDDTPLGNDLTVLALRFTGKT